MRCLPFTVVVLVAASACSTSSNSGPSVPVQGCLDLMSALASAYDRCGTSYNTAYQQQLQATTGGTCNNVVGLRDGDALEKVCVPSLRSITCADLQAGNLDPACQLQLQLNGPLPDAGATTDSGP